MHSFNTGWKKCPVTFFLGLQIPEKQLMQTLGLHLSLRYGILPVKVRKLNVIKLTLVQHDLFL